MKQQVLFLHGSGGERAYTEDALLAASLRGADPTWTYPGMALPDEVAARLPAIPRIALYHCRDDAVVPFDHLARYVALLPHATTRAFERGGHQFDNDLTTVAEDIRGLEQASGA